MRFEVFSPRQTVIFMKFHKKMAEKKHLRTIIPRNQEKAGYYKK